MTARPKRGLSPTAFLEQPGPGKTINAYRNNEVIYSQGSSADAVFYVQAGMVGTTRARVSTFLNGFKQKGFIRDNGGLQIDSERLTAFLQG